MSKAIPDEWIRALIRWATQNESVASAYVYGSRVKGGHRPDSDLDFAICLNGSGEDSFSVWIYEAKAWREELAKLLPVSVHLEMALEDDTTVWPAVQEHGILIYSRS